MADISGESFSSTSGLLAGAAPDEAPAQAPGLSRLNPSRPRGFRSLVRQARGTGVNAQQDQHSSQAPDSPKIGTLMQSSASMSQASGSPLLGRLAEVSTSSFIEADGASSEQEAAPQATTSTCSKVLVLGFLRSCMEHFEHSETCHTKSASAICTKICFHLR